MTKLYFGDTTTIATTIMILGLVVFIGYTIVNRGSVQHWGMWGLLLLAFGLVILLFRGGARRVGQDHSVLHRWELRGRVVPVGQHPDRCRVHWRPCHNRVCNRHAHREFATG